MSRRGGRPWRRLVATILERDHYTCRTRWDHGCTLIATTGDHIIPVSVDPTREMDPTNIIASCAHCNYARGQRPLWARPQPTPKPHLTTSRRWT